MLGRAWEVFQKTAYIVAEGANVAGNLVAPLWRHSKLGAGAIAVTFGLIESANTTGFQLPRWGGPSSEDDKSQDSHSARSSSTGSVLDDRGPIVVVQDDSSGDGSSDQKSRCVSASKCCSRMMPDASGRYYFLSSFYWGFLFLKAIIEVYFTLSALLGWGREFQQGEAFDGDSTPFIGWFGLLLVGFIVLVLRFPFDATTDGQSVDEALLRGHEVNKEQDWHSNWSDCLNSAYACLSKNSCVRGWVSRVGSGWHIAEHAADAILLLPAKELGQLDWTTCAIVAVVGGSLLFCVGCIGPTTAQTCLFEGNEARDFLTDVAGLPKEEATRWVPKGASCLLKWGMKLTGPVMHGSGTAASNYVAFRTMTGSRAVGWTAALAFGVASGNGFRKTELQASCAELKEITVQQAGEAHLV